MWELDHKEGWAWNNWYFCVVLEKTLESPLDSKKIKSVNSKGNQPWIFIGRTDAGKDWRPEEKGMREDEMVGWHHQLNGHEFEQILGDNEGQESLECSVHKVTKSWTWLSTWTTIAWQLGNAKLTSIGKSWRDCNLKWINAIKFIFFTICPMPTVVIRIRIQCIFIGHHV